MTSKLELPQNISFEIGAVYYISQRGFHYGANYQFTNQNFQNEIRTIKLYRNHTKRTITFPVSIGYIYQDFEVEIGLRFYIIRNTQDHGSFVDVSDLSIRNSLPREFIDGVSKYFF